MGLSIVKRIVDSYSGKIEVKSEYKKGTCFKIFLPYKKK
ncbi:MAG: ATP-binding protein [Ignavibacteriaceae bacterium]